MLFEKRSVSVFKVKKGTEHGYCVTLPIFFHIFESLVSLVQMTPDEPFAIQKLRKTVCMSAEIET